MATAVGPSKVSKDQTAAFTGLLEHAREPGAPLRAETAGASEGSSTWWHRPLVPLRRS